MFDQGLIKPTVYDAEYNGLESTVTAMKDLASRKVWGKAVIRVDQGDDEEDRETGKERSKL